MGFSDEEIRTVVDAIFSQFDKDGSDTLDRSDITDFLNAAFSQLNR